MVIVKLFKETPYDYDRYKQAKQYFLGFYRLYILTEECDKRFQPYVEADHLKHLGSKLVLALKKYKVYQCCISNNKNTRAKLKLIAWKTL